MFIPKIHHGPDRFRKGIGNSFKGICRWSVQGVERVRDGRADWNWLSHALFFAIAKNNKGPRSLQIAHLCPATIFRICPKIKFPMGNQVLGKLRYIGKLFRPLPLCAFWCHTVNVKVPINVQVPIMEGRFVFRIGSFPISDLSQGP